MTEIKPYVLRFLRRQANARRKKIKTNAPDTDDITSNVFHGTMAHCVEQGHINALSLPASMCMTMMALVIAMERLHHDATIDFLNAMIDGIDLEADADQQQDVSQRRLSAMTRLQNSYGEAGQ